MQDNKSLLDILSNNKFFKQIASEVKNSKGTPAEIMTRIANDYNIELPKNVAIEIHTASDDVLHFIIPADLSSNIDGMEETIVAAGSQQATSFIDRISILFFNALLCQQCDFGLFVVDSWFSSFSRDSIFGCAR